MHNLEKKQTKLNINQSNKNDIMLVIGPPSTKSTFDTDVYIYIEKKTSSSRLTKLGKKTLLVNNVLVLEIDNKGLLINKKFYDFVKVLVISIFVGILFYYPVFKTNDYSLKFLDLPFIENTTEAGWYGGPDIKFELLFPRFIFKIYKLTGVFASIIILFFYKEIIKYMISLNKLTLISCYVIFVNLIIFYFMPTKMLIINPFLLFLYLIIFNSLNKKKIILIILLNLLPWFLSYNILDIKYKNQELCYAKEAIDASFSFSISEGNLIEYINSNNKLGKCYSTFMGKYYLEFENGSPLRFSK